MMLTVLRGKDIYAYPYIDDVIFSDTWNGHIVHVAAVLQTLIDNGLTAKESKCVWVAK